eukprot:3126464-Lingulodinium_polyedra.AAC.1
MKLPFRGGPGEDEPKRDRAERIQPPEEPWHLLRFRIPVPGCFQVFLDNDPSGPGHLAGGSA